MAKKWWKRKAIKAAPVEETPAVVNVVKEEPPPVETVTVHPYPTQSIPTWPWRVFPQ